MGHHLTCGILKSVVMRSHYMPYCILLMRGKKLVIKVKVLYKIFLVTKRTLIPHKFAEISEDVIILYQFAELPLLSAIHNMIAPFLEIVFTITKMKPNSIF